MFSIIMFIYFAVIHGRLWREILHYWFVDSDTVIDTLTYTYASSSTVHVPIVQRWHAKNALLYSFDFSKARTMLISGRCSSSLSLIYSFSICFSVRVLLPFCVHQMRKEHQVITHTMSIYTTILQCFSACSSSFSLSACICINIVYIAHWHFIISSRRCSSVEMLAHTTMANNEATKQDRRIEGDG